MGTTAFILTGREKYTSEKFLADTIVATFYSDVKIIFENYKNYEEGRFSSTTTKKLFKELPKVWIIDAIAKGSYRD